MHCLLCHEKIPRLRHWRTKSEFCCDEHAAMHRRQTLERLVGRVSGAEDRPDTSDDRLAVLGAGSNAPPLPSDIFRAEPRPGADTASGAEKATTDAVEAAEGEYAADETRERAEHEPTRHGPTERGPTERGLAEGVEHETAEAAEFEDEAADPALIADEEEFVIEEAASEEEFVDDEADDEDELPYFEGTSVQRDEPFPIEISTAESEQAEQRELELPEPLEPAAFDNTSPRDLLELLASESSAGSLSGLEEADTSESEVSDKQPELGSAAQAEQTQATASQPADDQASPTAPVNPESSSDIERDLSALQTETPQPAELPAELAAMEQPLPAEPPASTAAAAPAASSAAAAKPNTGKKNVRGSGLQPVKAWDPTRARGARRGTGGRSASGEEGLNRLAGQLERDLKLRALGPGSDVRREGKAKLVCFLPVQGGNGSSTVSLHVAEAISHHLNKRVLLADFDFHSGTLAFRLGLKPEHTFVDVFKWEQPEDARWDNVVCPWKQLDVLVAPPSNTSIRPQSLDRLPDIFMSALRRYPYVIVDHPDAIYSSSRHVLAMSDLVYLVCTPEITSLHLARRKVQQIRAMGVPGERLRLIVNRTGSWGSLGLEDVGKIAGVPVSWSLINDYAALRDAVWNGGLVQQGSQLAKQLRELGWSVMGVDAQVAEESTAPAEVGSRG